MSFFFTFWQRSYHQFSKSFMIPLRIIKVRDNDVSIRSDEGLSLKMSFLEYLNYGHFTSSIQLIKLKYFRLN